MYGLDFGEPQQVETRGGITYVRDAAPTEQFWNAWRQNKDELKADFAQQNKTNGASAIGLTAKPALIRNRSRRLLVS